ncbi:MAG: matrixin family metalloprotease [Chloroflexi bacterium]|nr:matrixin family metalloprotease [Chloroflexota bacterium]
MRRRRTVGPVAGALIAVLAAGTVMASNFGSNTASYLTPAHQCDTDASSQCIANNGSHFWYPYNVTTNLLAATRTASSTYDAVTDVATYESSSSSGVDVIVMDDPTNLPNIVAWTECADGATTGGTDPNAYCVPQWLRYDLSDTSAYDTLGERNSIACQEMGHTLGLRHSSSTSSCMYTNRTTQAGLVQHDKDELNAHY